MRFPALVWVGLLLFFGIFSRAGAEPGHASAPGRLETIERQTFSLINDAREKEGLPGLVWNERVTALARAHSRAMADGSIDFGHAGFHDRMTALREAFPGMQGGAENVFLTSVPADSASQAAQGWLHSPAHRHNILSDVNVSGIGLAENARGWIYFTQIFIRN